MGVQSISKNKGLGVEASSGVIDAVIYGRASKDRLRLLRSIGDQIADCRTWCEPLGWRVVEVITDADRSASQWRRKEREGFEVALGLIESGRIQGFVTWEPSRAGRDLAIYVQLQAACQRAGVLYLTQGRVYDFSRSDDSFMMGFEFLRAEADANTMRERQLRTARRNAEKGRPHGRLAYGYRRVYDERTGVLVRQEPDSHTGQIVRDAARDVLAGASMWSVAMRLQDAGEPTPMRAWSEHPRGWATYTIRQILQNPTIAGKRVYRGEVIGDADWEPLIGWEDFEKLQRLFADPGRRVRGGDFCRLGGAAAERAKGRGEGRLDLSLAQTRAGSRRSQHMAGLILRNASLGLTARRPEQRPVTVALRLELKPRRQPLPGPSSPVHSRSHTRPARSRSQQPAQRPGIERTGITASREQRIGAQAAIAGEQP
jgi:DNA invertase Pin-like site-specific DNA recombinase